MTSVKLIVAGTRTITDAVAVFKAIDAVALRVSIAEIVSGGARGVDSIGEMWAQRHAVPIKRFHAEWGRFGRSAGPKRNRQMGDYADALLAVWDGASPGTRQMIEYMQSLCKPVSLLRFADSGTVLFL